MAEIEGSKITDITGGSELDKMDARAKAAVVVVSLGADRASQIYKYLSEQEIEDLTYEVAKLGKTNNAQVENALDEFYKMCLTHKMMTDGGLDYARSVLEKAFGETTARNLLEKVSKTLQSKPFNFFTKGDPKSLLALLQHERPQVIALIMAYMDPQQAAQLPYHRVQSPERQCPAASHLHEADSSILSLQIRSASRLPVRSFHRIPDR